MQHLSEHERQRRAEAFLRAVTVVRREAPQPAPSVGELAEASMAVLVTAALQPGQFLVQTYAVLSLHPAEGKRAVDDLLGRALVRLHRLARSGRGGQPTTLEVLKSGAELLRERGVTPTPLLLPRGGFVHSVYAGWAKEACEQGGSRVRLEQPLGGKVFDLLEERADGALVGYEVVCSGDTAYNAEALRRGASVAGVSSVVGVFAAKALMQRVARAMKSEREPQKVELRYAGEYCPLGNVEGSK